MKAKTKMSRRTISRMIVVILIMVLVVAISFTFAWFSGRFTNLGSTFGAADANEKIELSLIAQQPDDRTATPLTWPDPGVAVTTGNYATTADAVKAANYVIADKDRPTGGYTYTIDGDAANYNYKFLNESDWMPKSTVTKRLVVRSDSNRAVDFNISFDIRDYNKSDVKTQFATNDNAKVDFAILAEALKVTVYHVNENGDGTYTRTPVEGFENIGAEELSKKHLNGTISAKASTASVPVYETYEIEITLADTASIIYALNQFDLDINFESYSEVGKTHYVYTAEELKQVLAKLEDYDNIVLRAPRNLDGTNGEIIIDEFVTDKLFNLRLDDTVLKVYKKFAVTVPTAWGTIDLGMYSSAQFTADGTDLENVKPSGTLVLPNYGGDIQINAPRVAVRYGTVKSFDGPVADADAAKSVSWTHVPNLPDITSYPYLRVRALNGAQDIESQRLLKVGSLYTFDATTGKPVVSQTKGAATWLCVDIAANGEATFLWQGDNLFPDGVAINDVASSNWGGSALRAAWNPASGSAEETTLYTTLGLMGVKGKVKEVTNSGDVYNNDQKYADSREKIWLPSVGQVFGLNKSGTQNELGGHTLYSLAIMVAGGAGTNVNPIFTELGGNQWQFFTSMSRWEEVKPYFDSYFNQGDVWFRTPYCAVGNRTWLFGSSGSINHDGSTMSHGAVPAFTLLP